MKRRRRRFFDLKAIEAKVRRLAEGSGAISSKPSDSVRFRQASGGPWAIRPKVSLEHSIDYGLRPAKIGERARYLTFAAPWHKRREPQRNLLMMSEGAIPRRVAWLKQSTGNT